MKYELIERDLGEIGIQQVIRRINDDGTITSIPTDPANSDYQAYLNKDNPDWGKGTIS